MARFVGQSTITLKGKLTNFPGKSNVLTKKNNKVLGLYIIFYLSLAYNLKPHYHDNFRIEKQSKRTV